MKINKKLKGKALREELKEHGFSGQRLWTRIYQIKNESKIKEKQKRYKKKSEEKKISQEKCKRIENKLLARAEKLKKRMIRNINDNINPRWQLSLIGCSVQHLKDVHKKNKVKLIEFNGTLNHHGFILK